VVTFRVLLFGSSISGSLLVRVADQPDNQRLRFRQHPFHAEPVTSIGILISTTVLHLDFLCYALSSQLPVRQHIHNHSLGVFNLLKVLSLLRRKKEPRSFMPCDSTACQQCQPASFLARDSI